MGQTAIQTNKIVKECLGGVLFIDEAYALGNPEKRDSFAKECIDTLCEALSDNKDNLMVIIAGYEKELKKCFFAYNQGLDSRFTWRFKTDDYTSEELFLIFKKKVNDIVSGLPNIAHDDVPVGKDEKSNKLIKQNGTVRKFSFPVKSHVDIGEKNKQIDFKNSAKLSGSRFVILNNDYAQLERALMNFMLDTHVNKFSYTEVSPPLLVSEHVMFGTGQLPKFEEDQFEIKTSKEEERKFLIPTAEVVLTNLVRESVIEFKELPMRLVAATPCFRKEAGSYGKDTKGMMRQHQFYKVELVHIVQPENALKELDLMLSCAEEILKLLEIPYQVLLLSSGDMGFSAEKTYDIEVWLPSENKYREISSCSSCGTFQAKRMKARYKNNNNENEFVGTLNGSGLAVGRTLIAVIENYYDEASKVINIPDVLKSYLTFDTISA